jgi:hypothetical protein
MNPDPNSPAVVANLLNDAEAAMLIALAHLEALGIDARTSGAGGSTGWPESVRYTQVVVRQADLERAREAAREFGIGGTPGD